MTRINLVNPSTLSNQHLFAEYREIKHIPKALARSLKACKGDIKALQRKIPKAFTLNTGHVTFFYDKGEFLQKRFKALQDELDKRGYNYDKASVLDEEGTFKALPMLCSDYAPTMEALQISSERIAQRIAEKPGFYKWPNNK